MFSSLTKVLPIVDIFPYLTLLQHELKNDWYNCVSVMFMFVFWGKLNFEISGKIININTVWNT